MIDYGRGHLTHSLGPFEPADRNEPCEPYNKSNSAGYHAPSPPAMMRVDKYGEEGLRMGDWSGLVLSDPRFGELAQAVERFRDRSDGVIYVLERAKYLFGALPAPVLQYVAERMGLTPGDVSQAASYYDHFASRPTGEHTISVCLGTRCYLRGANALFDRLQAELQIGPGETTPDGLFSLTVSYANEECCSEPGFYVDNERFAARPEDVAAVLDRFRPVPVAAE